MSFKDFNKMNKAYERQGAYTRVRNMNPSDYPKFTDREIELSNQIGQLEKEIGKQALALFDLLAVAMAKKDELREESQIRRDEL